MRNNDTQTFFASAAGAGPMAREIVWKFLQDRWSILAKRYPGQNNMQKIIEVSVN